VRLHYKAKCRVSATSLLVKQTRRAKRPILPLCLAQTCQIRAEQTRRASTLLDSENAHLAMTQGQGNMISAHFLVFSVGAENVSMDAGLQNRAA
jgi:alpha-D-ribose 1-methylphosphonate 5-triphosphate synthase subunit PhnI